MLMGPVVRIVVPKQRVGVALVGFGEDGRILMLHHVYHPEIRWGLPGGWLHRREAPAGGALRELKEETGLSAVLGPVIHISRESVAPHIGIAYMAKIQPGEIRLSSEILAAEWYFPDALPQPTLSFDRAAISAAVNYPVQEFVQKREWNE